MTREEAIARIRRALEVPNRFGLALIDDETLDIAIEALSADIVRCKDCKHWNNETELTYCNYNDWVGTEAEDFCSFGERKEK